MTEGEQALAWGAVGAFIVVVLGIISCALTMGWPQ